MKRTIMTIMVALAAILPVQMLHAATDGNPELRLVQVMDSLNATMNEDNVSNPMARFISSSGMVALELLGYDFPTDPAEIAQYQCEAATEKWDFIYGMMCDSDQFAELVQLMAQADRSFRVKFGDINNPDAFCVSLDFTNAELNEVVTSFEDYAKSWEDRIVDVVGTVDTIPELQVNMEMLEDPATSLELMMANYYWDNEASGNPNRIWREDTKVIATFVDEPAVKADIANSVDGKEDLEYLGYGMLISASGLLDGPVKDEDEFDWLTFFCVVLTLGYDMEFRMMDSPDDPDPFIIPIPVSELRSAVLE